MDDTVKKQLTDLKTMYTEGLITEEIWKEKQRQILGMGPATPAPAATPAAPTIPDIHVKLAIPEELGGGSHFTLTLKADATISVLKDHALLKLKETVGESGIACISLDPKEFGVSKKFINPDDPIEEKDLIHDDVKLADAGFTKEEGALVAYLQNLSSKESCDFKKGEKKDVKEKSKPKDKASADRDVDPWGKTVLVDLDGKENNISSHWTTKRVVLVLVRRFGCALCQHQATLLQQLRPKLDKMGVELIAIGNGSKRFATKFRDGIAWKGPIYLDPESKAYKALSLPRLSTWQALKRFVNRNMINYFKKLGKIYTSSDLEGDGQQTGGVFVVGPGVGRALRYAFREAENEPDVVADAEAVLAAAGWTKEMEAEFVAEESAALSSDSMKAPA